MDEETAAAVERWLDRVWEISSLNPRMAADYLRQVIHAAQEDLSERQDMRSVAWLMKAFAPEVDNDEGGYVKPTYEQTAKATCIGYTQTGERCSRGNNWADPYDDLYLCAQHRNQAPGSWRAWRDAIDEITQYVAHASLTTQALLNHSGNGDSVYFVTDGRFLKIGTSTNVTARFNQLVKDAQSGGGKNKTIVPADVDASALRIELTIPGGRKLEGSLHSVCYRWHVDGEWFADCPDLRVKLASVGVPIPTTAASTT